MNKIYKITLSEKLHIFSFLSFSYAPRNFSSLHPLLCGDSKTTPTYLGIYDSSAPHLVPKSASAIIAA